MKTFLLVVTWAVVLTGLNAIKPLHVDDTTYYFDAAQIAAHPLDPYGYVMLRWSDAVPALHALAPPGLPYWWAAGMRLFGERPVLWKLWLFPIAFLFVYSLAALLRRFAPLMATPLLVMAVLSPVFLPSFNLMMDIPSLALSLTALVLFLRACDRDSLASAALAGVTAGLAMQTKYTAFLAAPVMLLYALLHRKTRLGLLAAALAGLLFVAWEALLWMRYGESHFVYQIRHGDNGDQPKIILLTALCPLLGGVASTLGLAALTVLRLPGQLLFLAAAFAIFPYFFTCMDWADLPVFGPDEPVLSDVLFAGTGAMVLLSLAIAARRLQRFASTAPNDRTAWFLVLWFALELVGYVAISPFPAVRRIMSLTVVSTLLIGCLAKRTPLEPWRRKALRGLVAATALLGFGFAGVDYLEARGEQRAAREAAGRIRREHPNSDIWYVGYWGFQFYAERAGMKQALPTTRFRKGDWLVVPDEKVPQQELDIERGKLEHREEIAIGDAVPLATLMCYYAGSSPLRHHRGPRIVVQLFRVRR